MPPWGPDLENKSILFYSILYQQNGFTGAFINKFIN